MQAEVFPINKTAFNYGNRTYHFRGKGYDELQANIPKYLQKIKETELELKPIPDDPEAASFEYQVFKNMIQSRTDQPNFDESAEDGFKNRMKLRQYYQKLGEEVFVSFRNLVQNDPIDWLDVRNLVYRYLGNSIRSNYIQPSRLRPDKVILKTDYCALLAKSLKNDKRWGNGTAKDAHQLVFRCYDIFPFDETAAKKVFDLSLLMAEFYVFSNYSTNGVGAANIYREMKEQKLQFDSSFHFHDYFARTINTMKDAHISYSIGCYEQFTFVQPIYIQHLNDENHLLGIYITKVDAPELQEWVGSEVVAIDGWYADFRIVDYGKVLGKSHYMQSRFTLGYSRRFFQSSAQDFKLERGFYLKRTMIPYRSYLVYSLRKPGEEVIFELKVHWRVFEIPNLSKFDDQYSYWDARCEAKPWKASTTSLKRRSSESLGPNTKVIKRSSLEPKLQKRSNVNTIYKATIDGTIPIAIGPGFAFFMFYDTKYKDYGVLVIQTFDVKDMDSWFINMRKGFMALIEKGITRLLLDLTGNSGGVLALAYTLLGVLSPSPIYPFPATEFRYGTRALITDSLKRVANCTNEAKVKVSPFKVQSFSNLETRSEFPDGYVWGAESEIKPKLVNGFIYGYSQFSLFLMDRCEMKSTFLLADVKPNFSTIIVVSDGLCGSSCAIVAAYLQQHGSPGILISQNNKANVLPPNLYSFAGGQVINFGNLKDVAKKSSCFDMIPDLLENAAMTITYRAIFNLQDKKTPLEYYEMPANKSYEYSLSYADSYAARWKDFFPTGMDIFKQRESISHGNLAGDLSECEGSDMYC